jgi:hypothetical protein
MGFTQRQGNGKFTRDEATALIEQLEQEAADDVGDGDQFVTDHSDAPLAAPRRSALDRTLARAPASALAAELQRRGWIVVEP